MMNYRKIKEKYMDAQRAYAVTYALVAVLGVAMATIGSLTTDVYLQWYLPFGWLLCLTCVASAASPHVGCLFWIGLQVFLFTYPVPADPELEHALELETDIGGSPFELSLLILLFFGLIATTYCCAMPRMERKELDRITEKRRRQLRYSISDEEYEDLATRYL